MIVRRTACRAVLLTPANEVLMIKVENPNGQWTGWITPGGGHDPGETDEQTLRRELREELGFENVQTPIAVWTRFTSFDWAGKLIEQSETYFLVRTARFEPRIDENPSHTEMMDFRELRWWKLEDIEASAEIFAPRRLGPFLRALVENGPPPTPIDVGV